MSISETTNVPDDVQEAVGLRGLVLSGGRPYILITVTDPETGASEVSGAGFEPEAIPAALREIADLIEAA